MGQKITVQMLLNYFQSATAFEMGSILNTSSKAGSWKVAVPVSLTKIKLKTQDVTLWDKSIDLCHIHTHTNTHTH